MIYWDREFVQYKDDYMKLFEKCMASQQEVNIEFLEKDIAKFVGRKHAVAFVKVAQMLYTSHFKYTILVQAMKSWYQTILGFLQHHVYQWLVQHQYSVM